MADGLVHAGARKQLLLGILAEAEHERLRLPEDPRRLAEARRWYRARFGLLRAADVAAFCEHAGLSPAELSGWIRMLDRIAAVKQHHAAELERLLPRHRAVFGVRDFVLRRCEDEEESHDHS